MSLVLDSSVALTWCLPDQASPAALSLLNSVRHGGAVVPVIWHIEVANILGLKRRSGHLSAQELQDAVALLRLLRIETEASTRHPNVETLLSIMARMQLTTYDAMYLDLALRTKLSLATFDKAMMEVARQHGVSVIDYLL